MGVVASFGEYKVIEGDVETGQGLMTMCWVEDKSGHRCGGYTDIDMALSRAENLFERDLMDAQESGLDDEG